MADAQPENGADDRHRRNINANVASGVAKNNENDDVDDQQE